MGETYDYEIYNFIFDMMSRSQELVPGVKPGWLMGIGLAEEFLKRKKPMTPKRRKHSRAFIAHVPMKILPAIGASPPHPSQDIKNNPDRSVKITPGPDVSYYR